jgi:hypothetical protein
VVAPQLADNAEVGDIYRQLMKQVMQQMDELQKVRVFASALAKELGDEHRHEARVNSSTDSYIGRLESVHAKRLTLKKQTQAALDKIMQSALPEVQQVVTHLRAEWAQGGVEQFWRQHIDLPLRHELENLAPVQKRCEQLLQQLDATQQVLQQQLDMFLMQYSLATRQAAAASKVPQPPRLR